MDEAAALAAHANALAPDSAAFMQTLAQVQLIRGQSAEALKTFDAALAIAPRDVSLLLGRAEALIALDREQEAVESIEFAESEIRQSRTPRPSDVSTLATLKDRLGR